MEELKAKEIYWIAKKKTYAFDEGSCGYNSTRGGDAVSEICCTPISQFDILTGKKIATYPSLKEAEKAIGVRVENIGEVNKSCGGYCFLYNEDIKDLSNEELIEKVHSLYPYLVYQLDKKGTILNIFRNTIEASNSVGKDNAGNLISCCLGKRRLCKGFQ